MKPLNQDTNILIVGLGVIGGSYARALTKKGYSVSCITKNQSDIDYAKDLGIISYGTTEVEPALVGGADLIVFALYPHIFVEWIKEHQKRRVAFLYQLVETNQKMYNEVARNNGF